MSETRVVYQVQAAVNTCAEGWFDCGREWDTEAEAREECEKADVSGVIHRVVRRTITDEVLS